MFKRYRKQELLTIKDWCTRFGIKIIKPSGFDGNRSRVWSKLYTKKQFEDRIKRSYISVNTEKGLAFLEAI